MNINIKKLVAAAMLSAIAVSLSAFAIPVGTSKCFPIQHLINVVAGVTLGPFYGVLAAFCTSLIRNVLGTGSLLAFPGSMIGALLCGLLFNKTKSILAACIGEVFGTGIIGGILCYPIAAFVMGQEAAVFTYVIPFLTSTAIGSVMAAVIIYSMKKVGALDQVNKIIGN